MRPYSLRHLSDTSLLYDLKALVARDRATTAALLAHIAEVDQRRLYAAAGFPSMLAYCVEELRLSEDAAYKRITAARAARKFPALFTLVAEGRLHLTAIGSLAPHLTPESAERLLAEAVGLSKSDLELMLVKRFGRPAEPGRLHPLDALSQTVSAHGVVGENENLSQLAPERVESAVASPSQPGFAPRYLLEVMIDQATHEKLRQVQALFSHAVPSGDVAQVLDRALDALIARLEKQKFAATSRPRAGGGKPQGKESRRIPAGVRRAVWERDRGECTFVGENRRRCRARRCLEFDHIAPVARGGRATVENLRLRCRTHNYLEAERAFGGEFMEEQREGARRAAPEPREDARTGSTSTAIRLR